MSHPLQAIKVALADALWKFMKEAPQEPHGDAQYVIDGGALLRIPWPRGFTFDYICQLYVSYVTQKYGKAIIIFDGYTCDPTTKDATHLRRTVACCGVTVFFTGDMILQSKKEASLNNKVDKQCFIHHQSTKLEHAGCQTEHARHDADVLIAQTVIASAKLQDSLNC